MTAKNANFMRAKLIVDTVTSHQGGGETLKFNAVGRSGNYPEDGSDENNTFANWTPSASLEIYVSNPVLHGKFKPGETFYVDFSKAD